MRNRTAEREIAVMSASAARAASVWSEERLARVVPGRSGETDEVDAFLCIFGLCKQLQTMCLDRRGIDCLIDDGDVGSLPEIVCRMLGLMVGELVKDASAPTSAPRMLTVTLRRRGEVCLCTISGLGAVGPSANPKPGLRRVERFAAELDGACMVRSMPERGAVAIMFDARVIAPRLPAAIRRYRAAVAGPRALDPIPAVPE